MEEYKGFIIEYDSPCDRHPYTVHLEKYGLKNQIFGQLRMAKIFIDGIEAGFQIKATKGK